MDAAEAYFHLGNKLQVERRLPESVVAYRKALEISPDAPAVLNNLAGALKLMNRLDDAVKLYQAALLMEPNSVTLHSNMGGALYQQGHFTEAISEFRHALSLDPNFGAAQGSLGMALLQQGDFAEGWPLYDGRFVLKRYADPRFTGPFWDGSALHGKRILLRAEQGFGDTIQFIRYASRVEARRGKVILFCPRELRCLLTGRRGVGQIVCKGEELPPYDVQYMLLSLPRLFGTTLETIPAEIPYLEASPDRVRRWQQRLSEVPGGVRVGLVWAGGSLHTNDHNRSLELRAFAKVMAVPGIQWFSLQKGPASAQARTVTSQQLPWGSFTDWSNDLEDFADTAALVNSLDLVITVDTAVAHLAGALGKPVWILIHYVPDWRWMLSRQDSPWYPTARLFRQPSIGDWNGVMEQVTRKLADLRSQAAS